MAFELHEECGLFGIFGHAEAAHLTYLGLHALQHRGQESAGIVSSHDGRLHTHRELGLVADVFTAPVLQRLPGTAAIGHVRYSTAGGAGLKNAQPFAVQFADHAFALAHNGNLVNADVLRAQLERDGAIFSSSSDTEVIVHLAARGRASSSLERFLEVLPRVDGAFSLLFQTPTQLCGVRDPRGFRPLVLGRLNSAWVLASETCALDLIEAEYLREIEPGEAVVIDRDGLRSLRPFESAQHARCVFEHVYFARPDSVVFGRSVYETRRRLGRRLAEEQPVEGDLVIPVPDSGVPAAIGYAERAGVPFGMGLVRSHYVGRTFIEPQQSIRHFGVKLKLNAVADALQGRRVVVVDDSIVRGTTSRKIVKMIRAAGAREVHLRISSPPTAWPCYYGIDTPTRQELIASSHALDEITRYVTADSVGYLSVDGLHAAIDGGGRAQHCDACFTGDYRVTFPRDEARFALRVVEA